MASFSFKTKSIPNGVAIGAVTDSGEVIAEFFKTTTHTKRQANSGYSAHRLAKGDCFEQEEQYEFLGRHEEVLAAAQAQLPKAFCDAKWQLRKLNDGDDFAVFNFLQGLTANGCCWYGNTPKNVVAAVKRAQRKLAFSLP